MPPIVKHNRGLLLAFKRLLQKESATKTLDKPLEKLKTNDLSTTRHIPDLHNPCKKAAKGAISCLCQCLFFKSPEHLFSPTILLLPNAFLAAKDNAQRDCLTQQPPCQKTSVVCRNSARSCKNLPSLHILAISTVLAAKQP